MHLRRRAFNGSIDRILESFNKKMLTIGKNSLIMYVNIVYSEVFPMKETGIIRRVDELGRIVLPIELRRNLDIAERDELEIYVDGDNVILRKHEASCIFCDGSHVLYEYQGKNVCLGCIKALHKLYEED